MTDPKRLEARALLLTRKHGVHQLGVTGAYDEKPNRRVEFLLHEVAHWLVLGNAISKVPRRLSKRIGDLFDQIPVKSANCLEIDTALVTYLAGYLLGLWTDPGKIAHSCAKNLKGAVKVTNAGPVFVTSEDIVQAFISRWDACRNQYLLKAIHLAKWFRPRGPLVKVSNEFPETLRSGV